MIFKKYNEMAIARQKIELPEIDFNLDQYLNNFGVLFAYYDKNDNLCYFINNQRIYSFLYKNKEFQRFYLLMKKLENFLNENKLKDEKFSLDVFYNYFKNFSKKENYIERLFKKINILLPKITVFAEDLLDEINDFNNFYLKNQKYDYDEIYATTIEKKDMRNTEKIRTEIEEIKSIRFRDYDLKSLIYYNNGLDSYDSIKDALIEAGVHIHYYGIKNEILCFDDNLIGGYIVKNTEVSEFEKIKTFLISLGFDYIGEYYHYVFSKKIEENCFLKIKIKEYYSKTDIIFYISSFT